MFRFLAVIAATVLLSGCSDPNRGSPGGTGPGSTAAEFAQAVASSDGRLACTLLSAQVSSAIADSRGMPCPAAVLKAGLPAPSAVREVRRYGRQAFVTTGTDTVFLSEFPGGWKIIGAGCSPRGDKPYDCAVSGG